MRMESALASSRVRTMMTPPIRSILVAADLSRASRIAVHYGIDLARQYGAKLHVVHVLSSLRYSFGGAELIAEAAQIATRRIDDLEIKLACCGVLKGVRSRFFVREGDVGTEIEEFARHEDVDLTIVGTNCRRGIAYLVRGSVGERIFRATKCPVLTLNVNASRPGLKKNIQHVLFATDFRRGSIGAFPYAVSLSEQFGAHLTVLHVVRNRAERRARRESKPIEASLQRLRDLTSTHSVHGSDIGFSVQSGDVADLILRTARLQPASVIVMGITRARLLPTAVNPPSIAYRVVCDAPCPVLTVRA